MKQLLLALLLFASVLSYAQFIKGDKFIGGTFSITSRVSTGSTSSNFSINPSVGYLVSEKVAVGVQLGYSYLESKNDNLTFDYKSSAFSVGLLARRYFSISDKCLFSINGLVNFQRGTETNSPNSIETKTQNYQLGVSIQPGFIFFPSPKWGLEARIGSLGYNYSKNLSTDYDQSSFNLSYGSLTLGVSYYLRKSK